MDAMHSRGARLARGVVAAAFATFVAALSHTAAGGLAPSAFGVAASFVLASAASVLLAGRSLSLGRLAASVAISQLLFHGIFSAVGSPTAVAHEHGAAMAVVDATALPEHGQMVLAHLAAGVATLVALRFGERAFWGLADTALLLFARLLPVAVPARPALPRLTPAPRVAAPRIHLLLSTMRHRGPPMRMAAA
jgi:hypothetical protein